MQTMDDGVSLAYTLYMPDGAAPTGRLARGGRPARPRGHARFRRRRSRRVSPTRATPCWPTTRAAMAHLAAWSRSRARGGRRPPGRSQRASLPAQRERHEDRRLGHLVRRRRRSGTHSPRAFRSLRRKSCETWTSLYDALWPQDLARSGIVAGFAASVAARSPLITRPSRRGGAEHRPPAAIRAVDDGALGAREGRLDQDADVPLPGASRLRVRHLAGDTRVRAPGGAEAALRRRPSAIRPPTFPGPDIAFVRSEGRAWFDAYLKGSRRRSQAAGDHRDRRTARRRRSRGCRRPRRRRSRSRAASVLSGNADRHPPTAPLPRGARELGRRHGDRHRPEACELSATRRQRPRRPEGRCPWRLCDRRPASTASRLRTTASTSRRARASA